MTSPAPSADSLSIVIPALSTHRGGGLLVTLGIEFMAFAVLSRAPDTLRTRRLYARRTPG